MRSFSSRVSASAVSKRCSSRGARYSRMAPRAAAEAAKRNDGTKRESESRAERRVSALVGLKKRVGSRSDMGVGHVCCDSGCLGGLASPDCERLNEDWRSAFQFARMTLVSLCETPTEREGRTAVTRVVVVVAVVVVVVAARLMCRGCEKYKISTSASFWLSPHPFRPNAGGERDESLRECLQNMSQKRLKGVILFRILVNLRNFVLSFLSAYLFCCARLLYDKSWYGVI